MCLPIRRGRRRSIFELVSEDGSVALLPSQQKVRVTPELVDGVARARGDQAAA